jgi:hypothetical protein
VLNPDFAAWPDRHLRVSNAATFLLGPLGRWRVAARGCWRTAPGTATVVQAFDTIELQPLELLGINLAALPSVSPA